MTHHAHRARLTNIDATRWLFQQPKLTESPCYVIDVGNGKLGGAIAYVASKLRFGGHEFKSVFPINFFIDPLYRGLPSLRLLRSVLSEADIVIGAYISPDAKRLMAKHGFVDRSEHFRGYYYALKRASPIKQRLARTGFRVIEALWQVATRAVEPALRYRVTKEVEADFIDQLGAMEGVEHFSKSVDWLRWRYRESPFLDCKFVYQWRGPVPIGLAVVHLDKQRNELAILDFIWREQSRLAQQNLLAQIIAMGRDLECERVVTHAMSDRFHRILSAGMFRSNVSELGLVLWAKDAQQLQSLANSQRLHIMLGDTDAY
jgi:hypothetical protein